LGFEEIGTGSLDWRSDHPQGCEALKSMISKTENCSGSFKYMRTFDSCSVAFFGHGSGRGPDLSRPWH